MAISLLYYYHFYLKKLPWVEKIFLASICPRKLSCECNHSTNIGTKFKIIRQEILYWPPAPKVSLSSQLFSSLVGTQSWFGFLCWECMFSRCFKVELFDRILEIVEFERHPWRFSSQILPAQSRVLNGLPMTLCQSGSVYLQRWHLQSHSG